VRFLLDEDVPHAVGEFLAERGHEVFYVAESLVKGSADTLVVQWVDVHEAVVVTHNYKHFEKLVSRVPKGGRARFRKASRLTLRCVQTHALRRVTDLIEDIEHEYERCQRRTDKRMMSEIGESYFKTDR
jgi:predicted nuclease of predicted toxin-antitoxin system